MQILISIFAFLFAIFLLVTIHEFGHFWVARRLGIKVLRFSIGFGRPIWKHMSKDGTEYVIAWLPLGGYVRLLDAREGEVPAAEKHLEFNSKPLWKRFLVLLAGPLTNGLLGLILFWLIFWIGVEQAKPVIGKILPNTIAAQAGLQPHDQLIQIDGHDTPSWMRATIAVIYRLGETGKMPVEVLPEDSKSPQIHVVNLSNWTVNGLEPDPLKSLGIIPYEPPVPPIIANVLKNHAAARAGLAVGDKIISIDTTQINDWQGFMEYIRNHPGQTVNILVDRQGEQKTLPVTIEQQASLNSKKIGFLGIAPQPVDFPAAMKYEPHYSWLSAWRPAWQDTVIFTTFNYVVVGKMLIGRMSLQGLGGPIAVFTSAKDAFKHGLVVYMSFLALFSVMLASINILPIPGLDGGHILLLLIEAIRGRPLAIHTQLLILRLGLILLLLIMFQATLNDVLRLF